MSGRQVSYGGITMIKSKADLKYYIEQDRIMNKEKQCAPYLFTFYNYYKKIGIIWYICENVSIILIRGGTKQNSGVLL